MSELTEAIQEVTKRWERSEARVLELEAACAVKDEALDLIAKKLGTGYSTTILVMKAELALSPTAGQSLLEELRQFRALATECETLREEVRRKNVRILDDSVELTNLRQIAIACQRALEAYLPVRQQMLSVTNATRRYDDAVRLLTKKGAVARRQ